MQNTVRIEKSWAPVLAEQFNAPYWNALTAFVKSEYVHHTVYPPPKKLFHAFDACPFDAVKVVILGQDPYHGEGQAHGLCFSVSDDVPIPPSLKNIYIEIENDIGTRSPQSGNLERWARQGVLLLNATLTVRAGSAGSHYGKGWELFTDAVISRISDGRSNVVFMLWGNYARKKREMIDSKKHLILESVHPSPLSAHRGFFGCRHFSQTNAYLIQNGQIPIRW